VRRVDYGEPVIGVGANPLIVETERALRDLNVALGGRQVSRRHQNMKLHGPSAAGPGIFDVCETRACAPGKVVNIFGVKAQRFRSVGIVRRHHEVAACTYDLILRKRDIHVERPEISEEFCGVVKLMAIPRAFPPHADFRKPLADYVKIAHVSGSRNDFG